MLLATLLTAAATRPDCEHTRCVLYGDVSWRGELLQEITTTIAVHQLHLSISANGASAVGNLTRISSSETTAIDATITYDIDSKAAMLRWRVASAEWAGLIVADSPEKLFVHGPEGELLELKLDAEPEAPEADAGPSPPSAGSLSDELSAHLSAADAPAVPLPPRGAFVYLQDVSSGECVVPRAPTDPELSVGAAPVGFGACAPATASCFIVFCLRSSLRSSSDSVYSEGMYSNSWNTVFRVGALAGAKGTRAWSTKPDLRVHSCSEALALAMKFGLTWFGTACR